MKKKLRIGRLILFITIILVIIGVILVLKFSVITRIKLNNKGYSKNEINNIIDLFDKDKIKLLDNYEYIPVMNDILINSDYKNTNVDKYINYYLKYPSLEADTILFMINNNAYEYEYSDTLLSIIKQENYNPDKLSNYVNYLNNYIKDATPIAKNVIFLVNNDIEYEYSDTLFKLANENYFIKDRLDRYMAYQKKHTSKSANEVIKCVNSDIDYTFYSNVKDTDLTKGLLILVNKYHKLSSTYVNKDLVTIGSYGTYSSAKLDKTAFADFKKLYAAGTKAGYYIAIQSPYRSYADQNYIYNGYVQTDGKTMADTYSARAGYSEHQTGLAIDVKARYSSGVAFVNTKEFTWMKDNAHKYGWILRYPNGKTYITGYVYEPWHYRYVGVEAATYIYENNITFEEYYAYYVEREAI